MLSDSETSEIDDFVMTPPEMQQEAEEVINNLLPEKSRAKYDKVYNDFILWKRNENAQSFSENVLLSYFIEKAQKYEPSTLWATYSMLKTSLSVKNNVDIKEYGKLISFLKQKSEGFRSKKSKVLTTKEIFDFLQNAPDDNYLLMKVILILSINGSCRPQQLLDLTTDDIEIREDIAIVKLPRTKTKLERSFVVSDTFFHIFKRYMDLRPSNMNTKRVLIQFKNNKCIGHVIGYNKISSVPKEIASYLKLANPDLYTGHCFKRTSATILADIGTDLTAIKRNGGWKSSAVAESYTENSMENEKHTNNSISKSINLHNKKSPQPSMSTANKAQEVINNLLPKSRAKYDRNYNDFILWKRNKNAQSFSENVLLSYFSEKAQKYEPSTLWSIYSMLKTSLSVKNNVDIKEYAKLTAFLKRKSKGFRSKKSKVLTTKEIFDFLQNAPDNKYLLMKVILILGINGVCRSQELLDLTTDDIEIREDIAIVKLPQTKTKLERSFVVSDTFFHIFKRYMDLRPSNMNTKRVLVQFKNNKCIGNVIGKNKISSVPKEIASYLKLANPDLYTGHCFKRTSATILADTGTDLTAIKRNGGWESSAVAKSYIEDSIGNKNKIKEENEEEEEEEEEEENEEEEVELEIEENVEEEVEEEEKEEEENKKHINNQMSISINLHNKNSPQPSTSTAPTAFFEYDSSTQTIKLFPSTNTSVPTAEPRDPLVSRFPVKNVNINLSLWNNLNINFN